MASQQEPDAVPYRAGHDCRAVPLPVPAPDPGVYSAAILGSVHARPTYPCRNIRTLNKQAPTRRPTRNPTAEATEALATMAVGGGSSGGGSSAGMAASVMDVEMAFTYAGDPAKVAAFQRALQAMLQPYGSWRTCDEGSIDVVCRVVLC